MAGLPPASIFDSFMPQSRQIDIVSFFCGNFLEKICIVGVQLSILGVCFLGLGHYITHSKSLAFLAMFSLVALNAFAMVYIVSVMAVPIKKLSRPKRSLLVVVVDEFEADLTQAKFFAKNFESEHLRLAQERLRINRAQLLERVKWLVGAVESVGLLPLAITAYFALKKLETENLSVDFFAVYLLSLAVVMFYIFAVIVWRIAQDFERHEHTLNMAIELKLKQASGS